VHCRLKWLMTKKSRSLTPDHKTGSGLTSSRLFAADVTKGTLRMLTHLSKTVDKKNMDLNVCVTDDELLTLNVSRTLM